MRRRHRGARNRNTYSYRHRRASASPDLRNALLDALLHANQQFSFWVVDRTLRYLYYNETHRRMMVEFWNTEPREGGLVLERVRDAAYRENARGVYRRALAGETFAMETTVIDPVGEERTFQYVFTPLLDGERSGAAGILIISVETTTVRRQEKALKEAEVDRDMLVHKLDHQVKNTIQSVISTLTREMQELPGAESSLRLRRGIRRLHTLSQLYDATLSGDRLAYASLTDHLREVIMELNAGVGLSPGVIKTQFEPITMATNALLPVCQLAGELLGALLDHLVRERNPQILITLERTGSDGELRVITTHAEAHELRSSRFAGALLDEAAASLEMSPGPPRTELTLRFPL